MNLPLEPLCSITNWKTKLAFGIVGDTGIAYVSGAREDLPFRIRLLLDADDLDLLRRLLFDAVGAEVARGEARTVGLVSPRPAQLAVVVARPEAKQVGVRLTQSDVTLQVVMSPKEAADLAATFTLGGERRPLAVGEIVGLPTADASALHVRRQSDGSGMTFEVHDGISCATGAYGEFLKVDDLELGQRVSISSLRMGTGTDVLLRAVMTPPPRATAAWTVPTDTALLELCSIGEAVDAAVAGGELERARALMRAMRKVASLMGRSDSFVLAKLVLSALNCELLAGNHWASSLWLGRSGDEELDIGRLFIDQGQTSEHDLVLDHQMAAWFQARNVDAEQGVKSVNELMEQACAFAAERDPALLRLTLRNWGLHLSTLFDNGAPTRHLEAWERACKAYGKPVRLTVFSLPRPSPWVVDWEGHVPSAPTPASGAAAPAEKKKGWW